MSTEAEDAMDCTGCGKFVSEHSPHVEDEEGMWHESCWLKMDWHVHQPGRQNPRPMTEEEKRAELARLRSL
jgi:hypothetical protein